MNQFEEAEKVYHLIRERVRSEDRLYNQRITWLISLQAALFASFGLILRVDTDGGALDSEGLRRAIFLMVALTGIFVALISHGVLTNGQKAMDELKTRWDEYAAKLDKRTQDIFPHPRGRDGEGLTNAIANRGFSTATLPVLFMVIWAGFITVLIYDQLDPSREILPVPAPAQTQAPDP
ncbi:hypothetical protein SAMN04487972_11319 [Paracoccus halophilus]|uniref:Uncharacterized protein n=1 Tax=Paracoccus halophilus TaxID=376733 RepID=A0A099F1R7_9RHOB|nr:hypothetical protein [Paracoccus halophilus]KGJ04384.1 hypothetical protein IT41_10830 [Paracoccus halophilus]SFA54962.1 hypothetical protein SAMN04487972_11319 [Paracoccus halophilus]